MCFFRRLQRHNAATSFVSTHTLTLTNTLTLSHTHMTGQPWLAGQVVPEEFFRVLQIFLDQSGLQEFFWPAMGSHNKRKFILRELIVLLFMLVFLCRHYAARYMDRI